MKRTVEIGQIGVGGLSLAVKFIGVNRDERFPGYGYPELKTQCRSMSVRDKDLHVHSPEFLDVEEAEKWLEGLTQEVKQIDELLSQQLAAKIKDFKRLEGEIEI